MRRSFLPAFIAAALLLAGCGSGGPPQLPLNAAGAGNETTAAADSSMMVANIRYELADGVKADKDKQDAFKLPNATQAQAKKVAQAFGVTGDIHEDEYGWSIGSAGREEPVSDESEVTGSAHVARSGSFSVNGDQPVSSGVGCAAPDGAECAPTTTTTTPPNMPSELEARATAESVLRAAGVDTTAMKVSVETFDLVRTVRFEPTVDGMTVQGFEHQVAVTLDKEIAYASGYLGEFDSVGSYELATLERAVERLNNPGSWQPYPASDASAATEPALAPEQTEPTIVKLTAVRVGLMLSMEDAGGATWLTPAYVFTTDQPGEIVAPAAADKYFPPPTTVPSDTGKTEPGGSTGNPGPTEPAPSPENCARTDGPIVAEVCTTASSYKAGDTVVFLIHASDPDRAFTPGPCGDGVTAEYGDDGEGDVRCLACSTTVPDGPGSTDPERKHTYAKAGTFTAKFTIKSGAECGDPHPNDSVVTLSLPVRIA